MSVSTALGIVGGGIANALIGQHFQSENMANQNAYTIGQMHESDAIQRQYTHDQYNLMKAGLVSAGFNPLTMVHGAGNTQESLGSSTPSGGNKIDLGNISLATAMNEAELLKAQTDKTQAEADSIRSKMPSEIGLNEAQEALYKKQVDKIASDIGVNKTEAVNKLTQAHLNNMQSDLVREKIKGLQNGDVITKTLGTGPITADKLIKLGSIAGATGVAYTAKQIVDKMIHGSKVTDYEIEKFFNQYGELISSKVKQKGKDLLK